MSGNYGEGPCHRPGRVLFFTKLEEVAISGERRGAGEPSPGLGCGFERFRPLAAALNANASVLHGPG